MWTTKTRCTVIVMIRNHTIKICMTYTDWLLVGAEKLVIPDPGDGLRLGGHHVGVVQHPAAHLQEHTDQVTKKFL